MLNKQVNKKYKRWLLLAGALLVAGGLGIWYIFSLKYEDTSEVPADFTVNATEFIGEFRQDMTDANKKYSEKIITVNGRVSEIELADTTANVKMIDTTNGAYIIFAFQKQHLDETRLLKAGDSVSIKGSCSNGSFSNILETEYITFKRCALNSRL